MAANNGPTSVAVIDRRSVVQFVGLVLALFAPPSQMRPVLAQPSEYAVEGRTWLDLNGDGVLDRNEPLLYGVSVELSVDGQRYSASRSGPDGYYRAWLTEPVERALSASFADIYSGDGPRIVLSAPPRPVTLGNPAARMDLGLAEPPKPHDERYFPETDRRLGNGMIWTYYQVRGGVPEFGRPLSDPFVFTCCWTQIFDYGAINVSGSGARRMNALDPDILGVDVLDGGVRVPPYDRSLADAPPWPLDRACAGGGDGFVGQTVGRGPAVRTPAFLDEYLRAAAPDDADLFRAACLGGLERWGLPTSPAVASPNGDGGLMQRFQRGVMWYRTECACVQRVPYGETLRRAFRGDDGGRAEPRAAAVFGLFAPAILREGPAVEANRAVGILATGGPTR